jgi:hypothetical protein
VSGELEREWGKQLWPNLRYYPGICLEGLRKTTDNRSQNSWYPDQDTNQAPPECKSKALLLQPICLILIHEDKKKRH